MSDPKQRQMIMDLKAQKDRRTIVSPEGLPLSMILAGRDARVTGFFVDMTLILLAMSCAFTIMFASDFDTDVAYSIASLLAFIIFNFYFIYFELAWRGRTPGKVVVGTMVVNRNGGELTPTAIVARNLTRQIEFYLPLIFFFSALSGSAQNDYSWVFFVWVFVGAILPIVTRDRLRLGDSIGGTLVVVKPRQVLFEDLSQANSLTGQTFAFTPEQLAIYGYSELRLLEDMLRRANELPFPKGEPLEGLNVAAEKIRARIGLVDPIPPGLERQFLKEFYTAQRAVLERALLFGRQKWNQHVGYISVSAAAAGYLPPSALPGPPSGPGGPR